MREEGAACTGSATGFARTPVPGAMHRGRAFWLPLAAVTSVVAGTALAVTRDPGAEAVLRQASVLRILPPPPATARPAIYASQRQPTSNRRRSTPIDGCLPVAPSAAPLRRSPASGWLAAAQRLNLTTSPGSPNSKCRSQHGSVPRREASPVFVHSRAPSSGGEGPYESRALRPDSGKSTQSTLTCGPTDPSPCRPTLASVAWPETPSPTIAPQGLPGAAAPFHHGNLLHQASHRHGPERVMAWHNATQGRSLRGTACTAPHAASGYTSLPQHGAAENTAPAFKTEQFLAGCKREFGSMVRLHSMQWASLRVTHDSESDCRRTRFHAV